MATYTVINGTAGALTDINAGGDDVPAYTAQDAVLTNTELGTLLGTAGISAAKSGESSAQKRKIALVMLGTIDDLSYTITNGTGSALSNVNAAGDDIAAYSTGTATLNATELTALLALTGVSVVRASSTSTEKHFLSKVGRIGRNPGV